MHRAVTWLFVLMLVPVAGAAQVARNVATGRHADLPTSHVVPEARSSNPDDAGWSVDIAPPRTDIGGNVTSSVMYNGRLVVGGDFVRAGGSTANNVAAWNGTEWVPLGTGVSGPVAALTVYDGRLIAGGSFETAGGVAARHVAAWDGTSWTALGSWTAGTSVTALCVFDDQLIAAADGGEDAERISAWDGASWTAVGPGMRGTVNVLMAYHGELYAAGVIRAVGSSARNLLAWDGVSWTAPISGLVIPVLALTVYDDKLIVGGHTPTSGYSPPEWQILLASWDGENWVDITDGMYGPFPFPQYLGAEALGVWNGELYAAGVYSDCKGSANMGVVGSWDGTAWTRRAGDGGATYPAIQTLTPDGGRLFACGEFKVIDGIRAGHVATWDGSAWSALHGTIPRGTFAVYQDRLIGEDNLTGLDYDGEGVAGLGAWDGTTWSDTGSRIEFTTACDYDGACVPGCAFVRDSPIVEHMLVQGDRLILSYLKSAYTDRFGSGRQTGVSAWDGSTFIPFAGYLGGTVKSLILYHDQIIAARSNGVERWNGDRWVDAGFDRPDYEDWRATPAWTVYHDLLILDPPPDYGGRLQTWDGSTAAALGEGPGASIGGPVHVLATHDDQLIAGGDFTSAGGAPAGNIAAWDGSSWQSLGSGLDGGVYALAEYNGSLVAGGDFTSAGGAPASHIAAWDGTAWSPLGSGVDGNVSSLTTYRDGLVVAGAFTEAGGMPAYRLAVWNPQQAAEVNVAVDVRPGSCTNPINPRAGNGHGRAVVPVAILGSADLDVHDIDPSSVAIGGGAPVRWHIGDVATPDDDPADDCACGEATSDGYDDAVFMFAVADIAAALESGDGHYRVELTGVLRDGTPIHGSDCVTLVGKAGGPQTADGAPARGFELCDNVPNPFNPTTRIGFYLPNAAQVRLSVYDVLGRRVATLVDGQQAAGEHSVVWEAQGVASGVYYYRIEAGRFTDTKRMVLLK